MKIINNKFLFWSGPLSQWYPSKFNGTIQFDAKYYAAYNTFNCCEQYMMASKAVLFNDDNTLDKIMETNNPKEQKALGRQVKNFDANKWDNISFGIVVMGNRYKFLQNPDLAKYLLDTNDLIIAEASPYDKIWGIGLKEDDPRAADEDKWLGKNLLGQALMKVREELKCTKN